MDEKLYSRCKRYSNIPQETWDVDASGQGEHKANQTWYGEWYLFTFSILHGQQLLSKGGLESRDIGVDGSSGRQDKIK